MTNGNVQTESYLAYSRLLQRLHSLIAQGLGESEEADEIRDQMDKPWSQLSTEQTIQLRTLSRDLHGPDEAKKNRAKAQEIPMLLMEAESGVFPGGWQRFLKTLRECEGLFEANVVEFYKSEGWAALGDTTAAVTFLDRAARRDPVHPHYAYLALSHLYRFDKEEALKRAWSYLRESNANPILRFKAAEIIFNEVQNEPQPDPSRFDPVIAAFRDVAETKSDLPNQIRTSAWVSLGLAYRAVKDSAKEESAYSKALQIDPQNDFALTARGAFSYGHLTERAVADFELASRTNTRLVWPFFFLAHYAFLRRDFEECLRLSSEGLKRPVTPEIRGELLRWRAICRFELDNDLEALRSSLSEVVAVSPENTRAQSNLRELQKSDHPRQWEWPNEGDLRDLGASHLRFEASQALATDE